MDVSKLNKAELANKLRPYTYRSAHFCLFIFFLFYFFLLNFFLFIIIIIFIFFFFAILSIITEILKQSLGPLNNSTRKPYKS